MTHLHVTSHIKGYTDEWICSPINHRSTAIRRSTPPYNCWTNNPSRVSGWVILTVYFLFWHWVLYWRASSQALLLLPSSECSRNSGGTHHVIAVVVGTAVVSYDIVYITKLTDHTKPSGRACGLDRRERFMWPHDCNCVMYWETCWRLFGEIPLHMLNPGRSHSSKQRYNANIHWHSTPIFGTQDGQSVLIICIHILGHCCTSCF